jgi:hypothetical protein
MSKTITLSPPPVSFIKSISEQGYTLASAISDLIDNSIAASSSRVEILLDTSSDNLKLYIADNGRGMTGDELTENMRIPSADLDEQRQLNDLGRFGLGLKTASFSQSRKFTVLSKTLNTDFEGRTWDVAFLKETKDWTLKIESSETIEQFVGDLKKTSEDFHAAKPGFEAKTLIIWDELYKLRKLSKKEELNDELEELRSHLSLIFHRYLSSGKLEIRLNNSLVEAFEPFPYHTSGVQVVAENYWQNENIYIQFQGIILPKRAAVEAKDAGSLWVPPNRTLEELQGLFVYRNDRLINYGGWLRTIPKSVYLQFGRIRIDISNESDSNFQINVAKSSLKIPFGLKRAMMEMIRTVATQAAKEYRERIASKVVQMTEGRTGLSLIVRQATGNGIKLCVNDQFELMRRLSHQLTPEQNDLLESIIVLIERKLNDIWVGENTDADIEEVADPAILEKIQKIKDFYLEEDYSEEETRNFLLSNFGTNTELKNFINNLNFK